VTGETARGTRNSNTNTLGGASLQLLARTIDTNNALLFQTNLAANGDTTDATTVIAVTQAGAVTVGPSAANVTHSVNGTLAFAVSTQTGISNSIYQSGNRLRFNAGSSGYAFQDVTGATSHGLIEASGAHTWGASGGTALHSMNTAALTTSTAAGISYLRININGATRRIPTYNDA
jgi:hypothetical protein